MILLSILSYLATCTTAFNSKWCTGQFTCDTVDLFMQQQGYHSVSACKSLCQVTKGIENWMIFTFTIDRMMVDAQHTLYGKTRHFRTGVSAGSSASVLKQTA